MTPGRSQRVGRQVLALLIGASSGALAVWAQMPLPWMLGAMLGTTILSMAGVPMLSPRWLRPRVMPLLGVLLGSSMTLEVLRQAGSWLPSIALMPVFIAITTLACMVLYTRIGGYDRTTAFFASMPGGLNEMILMAGQYGGDERRVAMAHGIRILVAICVIGMLYGLVLNVTSSGGRTWVAMGSLTWQDYLWLGSAALVGGLIGHRYEIPAGIVMVPMLLSGILHIAGVVTVAPPTLLVNMAQVVLGTTIGTRFIGVRPREVLPDLALGVLSTLLMLAMAVAFAYSTSAFEGSPFSQSFLAFAPGGLNEMSLLALAMGHAVAYVTALHIVRILLVLLIAPHFFRAIGGQRSAQS